MLGTTHARLGIDVGGTNIDVVVMEGTQVLGKAKVLLGSGPAVLDSMKQAISCALEHAGRGAYTVQHPTGYLLGIGGGAVGGHLRGSQIN